MDASTNATEIVRGLFGSSIEPVLSSHTCSHNLHSGRLYIASNALCFYSNMFGFERKLLIPISDITYTGTKRATSIKIRCKSMCLESGEADIGNSLVKLINGNGSDEEGDNETPTPIDSNLTVMSDDDEVESKESRNLEGSLNDGTIDAKTHSNSEEGLKERSAIEDCKDEIRVKKRQGEKNTKHVSEEEYVFKFFVNRDSVLKTLTILRAQASTNAVKVYPHYQNESSGNISLPQRMAAFSGKLATNVEKNMNNDTETKEKENVESKMSVLDRCKSLSPRPRTPTSTDDKKGNNIIADDQVEIPDWRNDRSSLYQEEQMSNSSITTTAPSTMDDDNFMSRSRTSSAETWGERTSNTNGILQQLCAKETILAEATPTSTTPTVATISVDSIPLLPLKMECKLSDWVKAKEISNEYKEIAVKKQSLPHSTCKSLDAFYDLFLDDHAPHSIPLFQENVIGDTNMKIQTWRQRDPEQESSISSSPSLPFLPGGTEQQERTITFSHPRHATLGPSNVDTTKTHICQRFEPFGIILHINTIIKDVPYSDCFVVEEILVVESVNENSISPSNDKMVESETCSTNIKLSVHFRIRFIKSTMFKKLITNQVRTEVSHWYESYLKMIMTSFEPNCGSDDPGDIGLNECSDDENELKERKEEPHPICISEKNRRVAESIPSPAFLPLESAVELEKGSNTELSPFWTSICLQAQSTLTPTICLIVVLLWMSFHIMYLKEQVRFMEEELKAIRIENAIVQKTLMSAISINSAS